MVCGWLCGLVAPRTMRAERADECKAATKSGALRCRANAWRRNKKNADTPRFSISAIQLNAKPATQRRDLGELSKPPRAEAQRQARIPMARAIPWPPPMQSVTMPRLRPSRRIEWIKRVARIAPVAPPPHLSPNTITVEAPCARILPTRASTFISIEIGYGAICCVQLPDAGTSRSSSVERMMPASIL